MKKKVLVIYGESLYGVLKRAAREIGSGIKECGYDVDILDLTVELEKLGLDNFYHNYVCDEEYEFIFSMQGILMDAKRPDGSYWVDKGKWIGWIFDDFIYHLGRVVNCQLVHHNNNVHLLSVDGAFKRIINQMQLPVYTISSLLHGGFESANPFGEKDIDILVPCSIGSMPRPIKELDESEKIVAKEAIDAYEKNPGISARKAVGNILKKYGYDFEGQLMAQETELVEFIIGCIRYLCRKHIIEAVINMGREIHILGKVSEDEVRNYPSNVVFHGPTDIDDVTDMMRRSKVVISPVPNVFEEGAHERLFTALLNKTLCFAAEYDFLRDFFGDRLEYIDIRNLEEMTEKIEIALNHFELFEEHLNESYNFAIKNHTWKKRGMELVDYYLNNIAQQNA